MLRVTVGLEPTKGKVGFYVSALFIYDTTEPLKILVCLPIPSHS